MSKTYEDLMADSRVLANNHGEVIGANGHAWIKQLQELAREATESAGYYATQLRAARNDLEAERTRFKSELTSKQAEITRLKMRLDKFAGLTEGTPRQRIVWARNMVVDVLSDILPDADAMDF